MNKNKTEVKNFDEFIKSNILYFKPNEEEIKDKKDKLNSKIFIQYFLNSLKNKILFLNKNNIIKIIDKDYSFYVTNEFNYENNDKTIATELNKSTKIEFIFDDLQQIKIEDNKIDKNINDKDIFERKIFLKIKKYIEFSFFDDNINGIWIKSLKGYGKTCLKNYLKKEFIHSIDLDFNDKIFLEEFIEEDYIKKFNKLIILIDDIDNIIKNDTNNFKEKLYKLFKYCNKNIKIIGFCNLDKMKNLDFLLKENYFIKEFEIENLNLYEKKNLIKFLINNNKFEIENENIIDIINEKSSGFSSFDIKKLINEFKYILFKKKINIINLKIINKAFKFVQPYGIKDLIIKMPKIYWDQIGGYEETKNIIKSIIEVPIKNPEEFTKRGIKPSKGILFYGPPGCSKTLMAKAIATESNLNFISIKGPEIFSKYVGDSEKSIRELFKKARLTSPCIIFFDEIDAIGSKRGKNTNVNDRVLLQLLTELDGCNELNDIIVIGATNRPYSLDQALLRPGRFDELIYIPLPDKFSILKILEIETKNMILDDNILLENLAYKLINYTGAEIVSVVREAGLIGIREKRNTYNILNSDFENSINKIKPRIDNKIIEQYNNFKNNIN